MGAGEGDVLQAGDGIGAVGEARVKRRRGKADEVGGAEIGDDVRGFEGLAQSPRFGMRKREVPVLFNTQLEELLGGRRGPVRRAA